MEETVTGYVSVRELNEFLDRMEEAGDRCKDEWIWGAVTATTGAIRKLIGLARKEDVETVIRCADCKYWDIYCNRIRPGDWYCGDARRKDDE